MSVNIYNVMHSGLTAVFPLQPSAKRNASVVLWIWFTKHPFQFEMQQIYWKLATISRVLSSEIAWKVIIYIYYIVYLDIVDVTGTLNGEYGSGSG